MSAVSLMALSKYGWVGGSGVTVGVPWPKVAMSVNTGLSTILMNALRTRGSSNGFMPLCITMPCQVPLATSITEDTLDRSNRSACSGGRS